MLRIETISALLFSTLASAACGTSAESRGTLHGPWRADVDTLGDTIVVRTLAGSEWGTAHLVEDLRIGRLDGDEHEMFGQVAGLAVTADGEILIYDAHATALRRYGPDGRYLGTIGGSGSGPGEYRNVAGIAVLADSRIVLSDFGNGRFNVYASDGEPIATWVVRAAIAELRPLYTHPGGGVFLHDLRRRDGEVTREEVLVRIDAEGAAGDTIAVPHADYRQPSLEVSSDRVSAGTAVPFTAMRGWSVTTDGDVLAMIGERYAVDVHRPSESFVLRIRRDVDPVPVSIEESTAEEERINAFFRRFVDDWRWDGPAIPATKPPIQWIHTGRDGTIWVRTAQPGVVIPEAQRAPNARTFVHEPVVLDVFASDGRFLGQVQAPDAMQLQPYPVIDGDRVWAVVHDENGVNYAARFRIVRN